MEGRPRPSKKSRVNQKKNTNVKKTGSATHQKKVSSGSNTRTRITTTNAPSPNTGNDLLAVQNNSPVVDDITKTTEDQEEL